MANERFTDKYGQCSVNYKEHSIHCKEQEKLAHPAAGSRKGNETPRWPASPCAPPGTAQSSYSPCCHGSAPLLAPLSCVGEKEAWTKKFQIKPTTDSWVRRKKEDAMMEIETAAAQGIKKSLPTNAGKMLFSYSLQVVSQNTQPAPVTSSAEAEGRFQPCPRSTCTIISVPTKIKTTTTKST